MVTVIAIDPGASGGIAWNGEGKGVQACAMPAAEESVIELLRDIIAANKEHRIVAYVELVTGYVRPAKDDEEKQEPGNRMFKFGRGVGLIIGALHMAGIEVHEVAPRTWQKPYVQGLISEGGKRLEKSVRKRILKGIAQRRYEGLQVTLKTADALLIHAHGFGLESGELLSAGTFPRVPLPFTSAYGPQFERLKQDVEEVAPVSGTEPEPKPDFCIVRWKGADWVFAKDQAGGYGHIRKASAADIINFPPFSGMSRSNTASKSL